MTARGDHHSERRGHRTVEAIERVRGDASEQPSRPRCAEHARDGGRGKQRARPECGQPQGMSRDIDDRTQEVGGQIVESACHVTEEQAPASTILSERYGGLLDGLVEQARLAGVQRVRAVDLGPPPDESVLLEADVSPERRPDGERMKCRAVIVDDAGERQLPRPRAPPPGVGGVGAAARGRIHYPPGLRPSRTADGA